MHNSIQAPFYLLGSRNFHITGPPSGVAVHVFCTLAKPAPQHFVVRLDVRLRAIPEGNPYHVVHLDHLQVR
jgi:hypothetical protein